MLLETVLFDTDCVHLFKIPPGDTSLRSWDPSNVVWAGYVRLIEQEDTTSENHSVPPQLRLRLKIELRNWRDDSLPKQLHPAHAADAVWAEAWYNPLSGSDLAWSVTNDRSDALVMSHESPKYYKLIAQLPDTGYRPFEDSGKGQLLQVALGLDLRDSTQASGFSESLALYRRHFQNFQEKFAYDEHLAGLQSQLSANLHISQDDSDSDDFGSFVGTSYD